MVGFIITVVVLALSLWLISLLPIGVDIDSPAKALIGGAVIGVLNGLYHILPDGLIVFANVITLGLLSLVINVIVFGLAAWLVQGFRLRWGILSAIIGAIALAVVNGVLTRILGILL